MKPVIIRALPFFITLALGVAFSAVLRSLFHKHRSEDRLSSATVLRKGSISGFSSANAQATFVVTTVQYSGWTGRSSVSLGNSFSDNLTMKEQALYFGSMHSGFGSATNFVISFVSPDSQSGQPVTSDATLIDIPRPRFWHSEQGKWTTSGCNAIVRVDLDSSGTVSKVENVPGFADTCLYLDDILNAASRISFNPALRNGVPVSQRISIMYRLH